MNWFATTTGRHFAEWLARRRLNCDFSVHPHPLPQPIFTDGTKPTAAVFVVMIGRFSLSFCMPFLCRSQKWCPSFTLWRGKKTNFQRDDNAMVILWFHEYYRAGCASRLMKTRSTNDKTVNFHLSQYCLQTERSWQRSHSPRCECARTVHAGTECSANASLSYRSFTSLPIQFIPFSSRQTPFHDWN